MAVEFTGGLQSDGSVDGVDDEVLFFQIAIYRPQGLVATGNGTNRFVGLQPITREQFARSQKYSTYGNWYNNVNGSTYYYIAVNPYDEVVYTKEFSNSNVYRRITSDVSHSQYLLALINFYQTTEKPIVITGGLLDGVLDAIKPWALAGLGVALAVFVAFVGYHSFKKIF